MQWREHCAMQLASRHLRQWAAPHSAPQRHSTHTTARRSPALPRPAHTTPHVCGHFIAWQYWRDIPCYIRREGGQSLVIGGSSLVRQASRRHGIEHPVGLAAVESGQGNQNLSSDSERDGDTQHNQDCIAPRPRADGASRNPPKCLNCKPWRTRTFQPIASPTISSGWVFSSSEFEV